MAEFWGLTLRMSRRRRYSGDCRLDALVRALDDGRKRVNGQRCKVGG